MNRASSVSIRPGSFGFAAGVSPAEKKMKWEEQYEKSKKFNVYETGLGDFKKEIKKKNV